MVENFKKIKERNKKIKKKNPENKEMIKLETMNKNSGEKMANYMTMTR